MFFAFCSPSAVSHEIKMTQEKHHQISHSSAFITSPHPSVTTCHFRSFQMLTSILVPNSLLVNTPKIQRRTRVFGVWLQLYYLVAFPISATVSRKSGIGRGGWGLAILAGDEARPQISSVGIAVEAFSSLYAQVSSFHIRTQKVSHLLPGFAPPP